MKNCIALTVCLSLTILMVGCDATNTPTLDAAAEETARIDQLTNETLQEVEHLTQTYDNILAKAGKSASIAYVPPGSNDALADALAEAGSGGIVVLASGEHHESGTVAITHRVVLVGEPGATLLVDTQPMPAVATMDPALHVTDASWVVIWGIEVLPEGAVGGTAILAERAPNLVVGRTRIGEHQVGVAIDRTDHARIIHNRMEMSTAADIAAKQGVLIINGARAVVASNTVSNATAGIFVSDKQGKLIRNETYGNVLGMLLCTPFGLPAPSGEILNAEVSATEWLVTLNDAHDNVWGYLVMDGSNKNTLARTNRASNNASYDVELAGDTERFGFFAPSSFENTVFAGEAGMTVKDCGMGNAVHGGTSVDTAADPCF